MKMSGCQTAVRSKEANALGEPNAHKTVNEYWRKEETTKSSAAIDHLPGRSGTKHFHHSRGLTQ